MIVLLIASVQRCWRFVMQDALDRVPGVEKRHRCAVAQTGERSQVTGAAHQEGGLLSGDKAGENRAAAREGGM